ncbi:MAG: glycosyltransferase [Myxococcales bacterium]|nr:glycosyltransferase [Myxococcales bacterium]MBL0193019.1 glycosyltransferase [Myxococcales bacterium]HQY63541.1 glycosyltransferase [Polyangiaceae bacterium]
MRVVAVTQIWPNSLEPLEAAFNRQQFRELANLCDLEVLAAVASFPLAGVTGQPPRPAKLAALPGSELVAGIRTTYLKQLYVPKVGVPIAVPLYLASAAPHRALLASADVIFGTWAYPDSCAAVLLARMLGKPSVVKVHGSDLNVIAKRPSARAVLSRVLPQAHALVSVSEPLSDELALLGVDRARIHLVGNGVDDGVFRLQDKAEARRELGVGVDRRVVFFVGRLEPAKGIDELMTAWDQVARDEPSATLVLAGDGVSRVKVDQWARGHGDGVRVLGGQPLSAIARWHGASDLFTLPSWREGTPNAVLEALASGRPVVATRVGGIPDVLRDPEAGALVPAKDPAALAAALTAALRKPWDAEAVRRTGPGTWRESAAKLHSVLEGALRGYSRR